MSSGEETRKIQFTGKSTYIISLPKQWITDLGLKQGDQVLVGRKGISSLHVTPYNTRKKDQTETATIEIEPKEETSTVVRKLVSLYFLHFKTITIKPRVGRITPSQRIGIRDAVKKILMGTEITADSSDGITVQILINLVELSVDAAFKRMMLLAKSMLDDALIAIKEGNVELAKEVINSDDDVDRFGLYIIRQLRFSLENDNSLGLMNSVDKIDCLGYRMIAKSLERIADHASDMGQQVMSLNKPLPKSILAQLDEFSEFSRGNLEKSMRALVNKDYKLADKVVTTCLEAPKKELKILNSDFRMTKDQDACVVSILEHIRRVSDYSADIGEVVLNLTIDENLKKQ